MSSLAYLVRRTFINKLKKALKRPVTYIAAIAIIAYAVMVFVGLGSMASDFGFMTAEKYAVVLSVIIFVILPGDMISYAKRKGLVFKQSEVHFVFPSPENPKQVLLKVSLRNYIILFIFGLVCTIFGILFIDVAPWRMLLFFLFFAVLENVLEGSIIIICYGNQTLPERFFKVLSIVVYAMMGVMVGAAIVLIYFNGFEVAGVSEYLNLPVVQAVPFVGWAIAFIHLLLVGPTTVNIVCTVCYLVATLLLFIYAWKMECTGEYYEDAMKFAEKFAVRQKKAQKGEVSINFKKKFKVANVEYKGVYAKAIYYRQLLEYKKNRFFIFGWNSLLFLGLGVLIGFFALTTDMMEEFGEAQVFVIPAVIAYVLFIFSGYQTKWGKELENPYTYLIPDSGLKKLWYSTKIEHIRAFVDGCLITLPGAVCMGLSPITTVLTLLLYVCLNANKLYLYMLSDALIGKSLGNTGKQLLRMLFQGIALSVAMIMAISFGALISIDVGFFSMILMTAAITVGAAIGASVMFEKMETLD